jgi:hypothetical protein
MNFESSGKRCFWDIAYALGSSRELLSFCAGQASMFTTRHGRPRSLTMGGLDPSIQSLIPKVCWITGLNPVMVEEEKWDNHLSLTSLWPPT